MHQVAFHWDGNHGREGTGVNAVAHSCSAQRAEELGRELGPLLFSRAATAGPSVVRTQSRDGDIMLVQRWPTVDRGGRPMTISHVLIGAPEIMKTRWCLGLSYGGWHSQEKAELARGHLAEVNREALDELAIRRLPEMMELLPTVQQALVLVTAELLRDPTQRVSLLLEEQTPVGWPDRDAVPLVYLGLFMIFHDWLDGQWTFATYDTVDTHPLRLMSVPRWEPDTGVAGPLRVMGRRPDVPRFEHMAAARLVKHLLTQRQEFAGVPQLVVGLADGAVLGWEQRRERLREILGIARPNGARAVAPAPLPAELGPTWEWDRDRDQERESGGEEKAQDRERARATRRPAASETGRLHHALRTRHEAPTVSAARHLAGHEGLLVDDRYLLTALIGQGGMARVWRGHDQRLKRPVAVKEILFESAMTLSERASLTARMQIEAQAAARMRHQNIVAVHDAFHFQGTPWIVMEYVPGTGLDVLMRDEGPLPWKHAAALGAQVADALAHVHAAGVIHRDLKPGNILVCDARVILTDFGISRMLDVPGVTTAGKVIGTLPYMSPEQLYNKPVPASDLWALGVTMYEAVEGHRPFQGDTQPELFDAIRQHPFPPPRRAGALTALLTALLDKDAARRPHAQDTTRTLRGAAGEARA